jgi:hypothetical protein
MRMRQQLFTKGTAITLFLLGSGVFAQQVDPPIIIGPPVCNLCQTGSIEGTVFLSQCPPDPRMGMPCVIEALAGCTVSVRLSTLPNSVLSTISGVDGKYAITFAQAQPAGADAYIIAQKAGAGSTSMSIMLSGNTVETIDLFLNGTITTPPPATTGSAVLKGTVNVSQCPPPGMGMPCMLKPVPGCTVTVYPAIMPMTAGTGVAQSSPGSSDPSATVIGGTISPLPPDIGYMAITDAQGAYSISGITVYANDPTGTNSFFVYAQKDGQSAQASVELADGDTAVLDLELQAAPTPPPVVGTSSIKGTVRILNCATTQPISGPKTDPVTADCLLKPAAGCTVIVSAACVPMTYDVTAPDPNMPPVLDKVYAAITDKNGNYQIDDIKIYGAGYTVMVMAQLDNMFGSTMVTLADGQTAVADVELTWAPVPITGPDSIVVYPALPAEAQFYADQRAQLGSQHIAFGIAGRSAPQQSIRLRNGAIEFNVQQTQNVTVALYAPSGRKLSTVLYRGMLMQGTASMKLTGSKLPAGFIFVRVTGETFNAAAILHTGAIR